MTGTGNAWISLVPKQSPMMLPPFMSPHCFRAVGSCGSSRLAAGVLMQLTARIG
jgi:hypothetical protein